jgi:hypothetical protein
VTEIGTVFDTYIDSMNNQRDNQRRMELHQQCMNEISKLGQTKERFNHNVAELLKTLKLITELNRNTLFLFLFIKKYYYNTSRQRIHF